ncbi:MAG: FtsX-like permease family protein, partial [Desulfovibrio sp.]|nr:FtsX-like permease family protein [Desulfovibrio sp.]
ATYTHAEEIAQIKALESGLNVIFSLVCAAAGLGFCFSTASSVFAGIKRKERTLGLLQLAGFSTGAIMLFPLVQVVLTALFGTGLASLVYLAIAHVINSLFQGSLQGLEQVCRLLPVHYALALGAAAGLSLLAALGPAWRSTKIEPSEVIRDV